MTVNHGFDLEVDDFLDDTFRSIPEKDLLSYSISSPPSENPLKYHGLNDFHAPGPSNASKHSIINSANTVSNRKNSLSSLFKSRGSVSAKQKDIVFSEVCSPNNSENTNGTTKINSRFLPGFTPKAKKRRLPGPAGFLSEKDEQHFQPVDSEHTVSKGATATIEIQDITNSQFSSEELLQSSWQNLQTDVSSCHNLLSTAKYYSIRRVLHETSKKKLPKHLVVPVLCVLIKKFNDEESSLVFMDDTGEISGKIDKEVLIMYKDVIQERTALILKKVTCICNILILKKQNVVSIYGEDGSVKHVQDLNSILDKEEPLKPMNCQCPGTPDEHTIKKPLFSKVSNSTPVSVEKTLNTNHKTSKKLVPSSCFGTKRSKENSYKTENSSTSSCSQVPIGKEKVLNILEAVLDISKNDCSSENSMPTSSLKQTTGETLKPVSNVAFNYSASCSNKIVKCNFTSKILSAEKISSNNSKSIQKPDSVNNSSFSESAWEEDLFCEDADDFDDILCSLDEKSFL